MTGMKTGAGEDPFAEDTDTAGDTPDEEESDVASQPVTESENTRTDTGPTRTMQIPYKLRRDSVQDGRSRVPLFLQANTKEQERDLRQKLEQRLDESVSLTDLREAVVLAGLERPAAVQEQLEEWGYGMTFED